tara:strand:- start:182 stop:334 length:153 start_codon:yes stop_codon:yes gene_type:complete
MTAILHGATEGVGCKKKKGWLLFAWGFGMIVVCVEEKGWLLSAWGFRAGL